MYSHPHNIPHGDKAEEEKLINLESITSENPRSHYYFSYFQNAIREIESYIHSNDIFNNLILPSALNNIAEDLSVLLDEYTTKFLDHDIEQYRKISKIDETKLNASQAIKKLEEYFLISKDLKSTYPEYEYVLSSLARNYVNNIKLLIARLAADIEIIDFGFNKKSEISSEHKLSVLHIQQTGSDLHHQGAQVLIIEFCKITNVPLFKIVYKPSSIEADTFITGNMKKLGLIDPSYKDCKSFIEILNEGLISQSQITLPTYLIIPRNQGSDNNAIFNRYGYIEFIPHSPWQTIDCAAYLKKLISEISPSERHVIAGKIEKFYNKTFDERLSQLSKNEECDYILQNETEENNYSFACGCLITTMTTLGIIDMHVENMIVSKKLPVLIDLENSFKLDDSSSIENTLVFHSGRGSFSHKSTSPKEYPHLYDITGLQKPAIEMIEKNRSYSVFKIKNNFPIPYALNFDQTANGISVTLNILKTKEKEFSAWFATIKKFNLCVRYIPQNTSEFNNYRDSIFDGLIAGMNSLENQVAEFKSLFAKPKKVFGSPANSTGIRNNSIFYANASDRMAIELSQGNIPVYFTLISERKLYDFSGHVIPKVSAINTVLNQFDNIADDQLNIEDFFPIEFHTHIHDRFNKIVNDISKEESRLCSELKDAIEELKDNELEIEEEAKLDIQEVKEHIIQYPNSEDGNSNDSDSRCCRLM